MASTCCSEVVKQKKLCFCSLSGAFPRYLGCTDATGTVGEETKAAPNSVSVISKRTVGIGSSPHGSGMQFILAICLW